MAFLTEQELRARFGLGHGGEIRLAPGDRLTPAARNLVQERRIRVILAQEDGRVAVLDDAGQERSVPVLRTDTAGKMDSCCSQCGQRVGNKPEGLTHLDAVTLAPKNHPRIVLRGKLDTVIAATVMAQTLFDPAGKLPAVLKLHMGDLRSWLGQILRAEVTGEPVPAMSMGDLDAAAIHAISHNPLKHLHHDHMVPEAGHGPDVALLNWLRAQAREVEVAAASMPCHARPDIVEALNRLSSAFYVLMLMTRVAETGRRLDVQGRR